MSTIEINDNKKLFVVVFNQNTQCVRHFKRALTTLLSYKVK